MAIPAVVAPTLRYDMAKRRNPVKTTKSKKKVPLKRIPDEYRGVLSHYVCRGCLHDDKKVVIINIGDENIDSFARNSILFLCPNCGKIRPYRIQLDNGDFVDWWMRFGLDAIQWAIAERGYEIIREASDDDPSSLKRGGHMYV